MNAVFSYFPQLCREVIFPALKIAFSAFKDFVSGRLTLLINYMKFIKFLQPNIKYKTGFFLIIIALLFILSLAVRFKQFYVWKKSPEIYFVDETPMMSTPDAYLWIKNAKDHKYEKLSSNPLSVPLLSYLLSKLSIFFNDNIYFTGIYIIPILAGLFIVPLSLYFFEIGYPACGILGSLVGSFSSIYFIRTSTGRVDTDVLNLFFPFLASYFILLTIKKRDNLSLFLYPAMVGITMYLFNWWYSHSMVTVYLTILVISLLFNKPGIGTLLFPVIVFFAFSDPISSIAKIRNYSALLSDLGPIATSFIIFIPTVFIIGAIYIGKKNKPAAKKIINILLIVVVFIICLKNYHQLKSMAGDLFNQHFLRIYSIFEATGTSRNMLLDTVTETRYKTISQTLSYIFNRPELTILGFIFFILFSLQHWKKLLPLAPVLAMGLLSFRGSNRFIMFLAPFVGIGYGYIMTLAAASLFSQSKQKIKEMAVYGLCFIFFLTISMKSALSYTPQPSVSTETFRAFTNMKERLNKKSIILTWWDYGWLLEDLTEAELLLTGGASLGSRYTVDLAKALSTGKQTDLFKIKKGGPDNEYYYYLLFTGDMIGKFAAINAIAESADARDVESLDGLIPLNCRAMEKEVLNCGGAVIDLREGILNDKTKIKKAAFVINGYVVKEKQYNHKNGVSLDLLIKDKGVFEVYLMNDSIYYSNFNQLFLLGNFDPTLFEEVYNSSPSARLFRIRK